MARILPNDFTSYDMTDQEVLEASLFTTAQKQFIQNQLSNAALEKNGLEFDPINQLRFAQEEASLKGQIDAFRFLLDTSAVAEETLNQSPINLET